MDGIVNGETDLVVNTPIGKLSQYDDPYIRKAAIKYEISSITTVVAALVAARGIAERRAEHTQVRSLQAYHRSTGHGADTA